MPRDTESRLFRCALLAASVILAGAYPVGAVGQAPASGTPGTVEREILDVSEAWFDARTRGDLAAMDRLQTDDFLMIQPTPEGIAVLARDKEKEAVPTPSVERPTVERHLEGVRVRQYGSVAVLTALATVRARTASGRQAVSQAVITQIWVMQEGAWRLSHFQAMNVPKAKPPE